MVIQTIQMSLRQMIRRPFLPVLNVIGLALGITVSLLIFLYAYVETHYDDWVTNQENLYRIEGQYKGQWSGYYLDYAVNALGPAIRDFPEIESVVRILGNHWLVKRDDFVNYELIFIVEEGFLDMFPLQFVAGHAETAFQTRNSIILSDKAALQYFGDEQALGKTLTIDSTTDFIVSGVFKDVGRRTDYQFNFIIPFQEALVHEPNSWNVYDSETFVRLKPGAPIKSLYERIAQLVDEHRPLHQQTDHVMRERFQYFLQPFSDLHLGSYGRTAANSLGNYKKIYAFVAIAVLVLVISVFNYISLATARALEREREFCLRKISGAGFRQIIQHTIMEAFLLTALAGCCAWALSEILLPYANMLFDANYSLMELLGLKGAVLFVGGILVLSLAAGVYPAMMIRNFKPTKFLSGNRSSRQGAAQLRTILVFLQFSICIGLVIGAVTISRQMAYINQLDLGYDPVGLVSFYGLDKSEVTPTAAAFKERASKIPGVQAITRAKVIPLGSSNWFNVFYSEHISMEDGVNLRMIASDYDFIDTYGAKLITGRRLSHEYADDTIDMFDDTLLEGLETTRNVIVNRQAVAALGYRAVDDIIGKEIFIKINNVSKPLIVVGVIEGMQFDASEEIISPKIHFYAPNRFRAAPIRVDTVRTQQVVAEIEALWREMYPDVPAQFFFQEELLERDHADNRNQMTLIIVFSCLAILLSLMGLIGLVSNSIAHRSKEISIRRVHGASKLDNVRLLTWQYIKPVVLANIPAWLVAYYYLSNWLEQYPQRIDVGLEYYVIGGSAILIVTAIITAALVTRTASLHPAHVLKYE